MSVRSCRQKALQWLFYGAISVSSSACAGLSYVAQGAAGQFDLWRRGRNIDEVISDRTTDERTRGLLREVEPVKQFAAKQGLKLSGNYEEYVAAAPNKPKDAVVWFVNASKPLVFEPKLFSFPIVGSFPGLSWFSEDSAAEFAAELREEGWDVHVRGVGAYSTGGWFDDPVLWTMFADHENAYGYLVNTILHESVHASVLVKGQQYFNESLASFVADELTPRYLASRFGEHSRVAKNYASSAERFRQRMALLVQAYSELDAVYRSSLSERRKLQRKREIFAALERRVEAKAQLNNATLIGIQLYRVGAAEFSELLQSCDQEWVRFMRAVGTLRPEHFGVEQQPEFGPVVLALARTGCGRLPAPNPPGRVLLSKPMQQKQRRNQR